jgi:hypothetical protein
MRIGVNLGPLALVYIDLFAIFFDKQMPKVNFS